MNLHQPFAKYDDGPNVEFQDQDTSSVNCVVLLSRKVCQANALRLVEILVLHHNKFGSRYSNIFALQHASVGALALLACTPLLEETTKKLVFEHLHCLKEVLSELASIYQLAQSLHIVLGHVLRGSVIDGASPPDITHLAFRNSSNSTAVSSSRQGLNNLSLPNKNTNANPQINNAVGYDMQMFPFATTPSSIFDFRSGSNGDLLVDDFMSNV